MSGLVEYPSQEGSSDVNTQLGEGYRAYYLTGDKAHVVLTYTGLENWSYQGKKITSVRYDIDISPNYSNTAARNGYEVNGQYEGGLIPTRAMIMFGNDPTKGFEIFGVKLNATLTAYYEDGSPVNFDKGTAYLSVGSLNNYMNLDGAQFNNSGQWSPQGASIEATQVVSGGQAVGLAGSTVTAHDGGWLYSDSPNTIADGSQLWDGIHPTYSSKWHYDGHLPAWDNNGSPDQYLGAGLIRLSGDKLVMNIGTIDNGIDSNATYRNWMWWNASGVIPKTPAVEIHYHYDVKIQKRGESYSPLFPTYSVKFISLFLWFLILEHRINYLQN